MEEKNTNEVVNNNETVSVEPVTPVQPLPVEPVTVTETSTKSEENEKVEVPTVQAPPVDPVPTVQLESEKQNTNNPKKGNKFLVILLLLIILGIGGYIVYDKFIVNNEPNNEVNENNNGNSETENNESNEEVNEGNNDSANQNESNNQDKNNTQSNEVVFTEANCLDGNGCKFSIGDIKFDVVNISNGSLAGNALYINGNKAVEGDNFVFSEEDFWILDDIIIVQIGKGLDHFATFYIFNKQGKVLLNGDTIDSQFGDNMILDTFDDMDSISIDGNKIKIKASRFTHGPSILGEDSAKPVINKNTSCDTIVMGTYEIEYYGNGKLSEIKNTSYVTLRDAINNHGYSNYSNYVNCK